MSLPAAQPAYVLRGHSAQIHSVSFMRFNSRLVTGDADGWIVVWNLATKRPVAAWKAHEGTIMGVRSWGSDKLITLVTPFSLFLYAMLTLDYRQGKDFKLIVWKFAEGHESGMSVALPVETPPEPRKRPWLLHHLMVNTTNFCSFAQCAPTTNPTEGNSDDELLVAVPNAIISEVCFLAPNFV